MQDDRFDGIPLIPETINPDIWAEEISVSLKAQQTGSGIFDRRTVAEADS